MFAEKLILFSEKFDPKLFLSRIHQRTSAADLEAGALALKSDLKGRTQQRKQLVKDNFDCFVSCKTTIDGTEKSHSSWITGCTLNYANDLQILVYAQLHGLCFLLCEVYLIDIWLVVIC